VNQEQIGGIVRAVVAALGGYLVGQGIVDQATMVTIGGAIATLVVSVWSVYSNKAKPV